MSANEIEGTTLVLAVNVALVAPAGTVTLGGTVTCAGLLLDSVTTAPPTGAGAYSVTVPVKESPVTTAPVPTPRVESSLNLITVRTGLTGSPATPETPVPGISAVVHRLSGIDNAGTLAVKLALV